MTQNIIKTGSSKPQGNGADYATAQRLLTSTTLPVFVCLLELLKETSRTSDESSVGRLTDSMRSC